MTDSAKTLETVGTERARLEQELALYRLVADSSHEMELLYGPDGRVLYASPSCLAVTGHPAERFLADSEFLKSLAQPDAAVAWVSPRQRLAAADPNAVFEWPATRADGAPRWLEIRSSRLEGSDGGVLGLRVTVRDMTDFKRLETRLEQAAMRDPLTGFLNRTMCLERIRQVLERSRRHEDYRFAVLYFDIDKIKSVNFRYGPAVGDQLIGQAGRRLERCLRGMDAIARIGGDKFAIVLEEVRSGKDAVTVVKRILREMGRPFELGAGPVHVTASVGVVLSPAHYDRPEELLRNANIAMRRAKESGRGRFKFFHSRLLDEAVKAIALEEDLRCALERGEFHLQFQPILSLETKRLTGFEALIRWRHPQRGCVMPGEFIPIAEDAGLITDIGRWVLFEACSRMAAWRKDFPHVRELTVNVNLSAKQLAEHDLARTVDEALRQTGLPASRLMLEITESALMENPELSVLKVRRLKTLGVKFSLDDFGTGYSSLSYLHAFPIDSLKVDRSFVSRMERNEKSLEIVQAVINLAHSFGLDVCAEGVEIEEQSAMLSSLRCETGQGYLFARPMDPERIAALLREEAI